MLKFIHSRLNHYNNICKSIALSKPYCVKPTLKSNYIYMSCKYRMSHDDWYTDLSQLVEKNNMACHDKNR